MAEPKEITYGGKIGGVCMSSGGNPGKGHQFFISYVVISFKVKLKKIVKIFEFFREITRRTFLKIDVQ